ncbi:teichoic acid transport system permease protein [Hamadaea flava]|uniref:Transport permease protein n=1 Tax=Hamadaea flava TaxID=1742688 RepID=A0ABV8LWG2_9ACTN|nr:ABC transporter permease [Hamadaea flava]MCP2327389.1 teichoic acid transport system permease protein [Hamadaea flava]
MADLVIARQENDSPLRDFAARHGLHESGLRPSLPAYAREVFAYRHFMAVYANAKVVAGFGQTRLGRLWQVMTPVINAGVYYLIFGVVINTRAGVPNFIAYLCVGLFVFNFSQTVVQQAAQAISGNLGLLRALRFPRASLPIAAVLSQMQHMAAAMVVLAGIVLLSGEPLTWHWLLLVPTLILQSLFNTGLALVVARLGGRTADLRQVIPFVMRTWMYGSGVFYSVNNFAENLPAALATAVRVNPLLVYVELARDALVESSPLSSSRPVLWALGVGWALVVALGGFIFFWHGEQTYGRG